MLSGPGGNILPAGRARARQVPTDAVPPAQSDVVIIGGGLIGVSTAFELAKAGVSVTLCEKGVIAREASGGAQGQVSSAGLEPWTLECANLAKDLWAGLAIDARGLRVRSPTKRIEMNGSVGSITHAT
jgi:glycine/D-amino acid oxidase-like deaminating enzyme